MAPKEDHSVWLFDSVLQFLSSPIWTSQILTFIDENCVAFDNEEENKLQFTLIHEKFKELVDALLETHLSEMGITPEQFVEACDKGAKNPTNAAVLRHILAVDDFTTFKALMVKRNLELNEEAMNMWRLKQEAAALLGQNGAAGAAEEDNQEDEEDIDEEEQLRRAIRMSEEEHRKLLNQGKTLESLAEEQMALAILHSQSDDEALRAAQAREDAELEMAIAMSLAAEEERKKRLDWEKRDREAMERAEREAIEAAARRAVEEKRALVEKEKQKVTDNDAAIKALERDRLAREEEVNRRTESARQIVNELRQAKENVEEESRSKKGPPPTRSIPMPESQGKDVEEEIRNRQEFLKKTRDALVARKAREREEEARKFKNLTDSDLHGAGARSTNSLSVDANEIERARMRIALGQRMKQELLEEESRRRKEGDSEADSELQKQMQKVSIATRDGDDKARLREEARLEELRREAERKKALDKLHSNIMVVEDMDDFAFSEK